MVSAGGRRGTTCALLTSSRAGGRGGSVQPRPAAEGTEPPALHPAPAGGTGATHTSEGATKLGGRSVQSRR